MVDYNFIQTPTYLNNCLDVNCSKLLDALIQLSSMYADKDGWFFRSNADIEAQAKLSKRTINGALDALLSVGVIDFIPQQQGKGVKQTSRLYKVNFERFADFENIPFEECYKNPKYQIETSDYKHGTFVWQGKEWAGKQASLALTSAQSLSEPQHKVPTNIDNIENRDIIEN